MLCKYWNSIQYMGTSFRKLRLSHTHTALTTLLIAHRKGEYHMRSSVAKNLTRMGNFSLEHFWKQKTHEWKWSNPRAGKQTTSKQYWWKASPKRILQLLPFSWSRIICFSGCAYGKNIKLQSGGGVGYPKKSADKRRAPFQNLGMRMQKMIMKWQMSLRKSMGCIT